MIITKTIELLKAGTHQLYDDNGNDRLLDGILTAVFTHCNNGKNSNKYFFNMGRFAYSNTVQPDPDLPIILLSQVTQEETKYPTFNSQQECNEFIFDALERLGEKIFKFQSARLSEMHEKEKAIVFDLLDETPDTFQNGEQVEVSDDQINWIPCTYMGKSRKGRYLGEVDNGILTKCYDYCRRPKVDELNKLDRELEISFSFSGIKELLRQYIDNGGKEDKFWELLKNQA